MLENCQTAQERWGGVSDIIDRWLKERRSLLVQFCELSDINVALHQPEQSRDELLRHFCQTLVDYVSAGHFEIYDQLVKEGHDFDDKEGLKEASQLYKTIDATTEELLDFNDKYQETDDLEALQNDLSKIGEYLATRFEAEDRMIEVLHVAHKDQVTG